MKENPYKTIEFQSPPISPEFIERLKRWAWEADLDYAITTGLITNHEGYLITQGKIRSWEELEEYRKDTSSSPETGDRIRFAGFEFEVIK